ncbi:MAG: type II secretion system F family protein [Rhodoglobus sp.]
MIRAALGRRTARRSRVTPLSEVAMVTQRLAVLLAAGVAPGSAWRYVAVSTGSTVADRVAAADSSQIAETISAAAAQLDPLEAGAWRALAAAWSLATRAGAPVAPCLREYSRSLRDLSQSQRDSRVALAAPVATTKMVMTLPAIGVLFGVALGFNTLGTLVGTPLGWVCLVLGTLLIFAAVRWNSHLVARARPCDAAPGIGCDLMAIAVSGGGSLDRAREMLDETVQLFSMPAATGVDEVLELSRSAGVPAAELLRSEAEEQRRVARADAQERAAALAVRLMLPLGVCILPAFMVLGVFPLLITVITSTVTTF